MKAITLLLFIAMSLPALAQSPKLLAHYPLLNNAAEKSNRAQTAQLVNAPFTSDGIYLAGNYGSYDANDTQGNLASFHIPNFNLQDFAVAVKFKTVESNSYSETLNILSLSRGCRHLNIYTNSNDQLGLQLNNGDITEYSEIYTHPEQWYKILCSYQASSQTTKLYVNGSLVLTMKGRIDDTHCGSANDFSTTDFSNGNAFKGYLKDLKVYNRAITPDDLKQIHNPKDEDEEDEDEKEKEGSDDKEEHTDEDHNNHQDSDDHHSKPKPTGDLQVSYTDIALPTTPFYYAQITPRPDGYSYLFWNENKKKEISTFGNLHMTILDQNFNKVGQDATFGHLEIRQALAIDNQYIYLIVGESKGNTFNEWGAYEHLEANILYFMKVDRSGRVIFKTTLFGDKGQGPKAIWADNGFGSHYETKLSYNGEHFGLYTGIRKNFSSTPGKNDVHQGDQFMLLTKDGRILEDKIQQWYSSHAFYQKMQVNDKGEFITANLGDAYPVGVIVRNRMQATHANVWPPQKVTYQSGKTWYFAAGRLGEMLVKDDDIYLIHCTSPKNEDGRSDKADILFMKLNSAFEVQQKQWVTPNTTGDERYLSAGWLGNNILLAYADDSNYQNKSTQVVLLDRSGKAITTPIQSKLICRYSTDRFIPFPDNSLVMIYVDHDGKQVKVMKVTQ